MAVLDTYTDSNISSAGAVNKLLKAINSAGGVGIRAAFATFEVAAGDDNGSVYRIFKDVDANAIPILMLVASDAIANATDYDIGLYKPNFGVVVDKDVLADGLNISAGYLLSHLTALNGLSAIAIESRGKNLRELADATVDNQDVGQILSYDLAITANTVGTAAGTVSVLFIYGI